MKDTTIAVGLAKNVFEIAISREAWKVSKQLRVSRPKLVSFFAKQSAATVLLEACGSAHFGQGRCDGWDTTSSCSTSPRKAVSTREQERPRGHQSFARGLPERGDSFRCPSSPCASTPSPRSIAYAQDGSPHEPHASMPYAGSCASSDSSSPRALTSSCPPSPSSSKTLILICPTCSVRTCVSACSEIRELKDKCAGIEHELKALAKQLPEVQRLLTIPGIGTFDRDRHRRLRWGSAPLPIGTPLLELPRPRSQENSSGDIRRLGRITKRGDSYLRTLLTQGGRAVLRAANVSKSPPTSSAPGRGRSTARGTQQSRDCCRQQTRPDSLGRLHPRE